MIQFAGRFFRGCAPEWLPLKSQLELYMSGKPTLVNAVIAEKAGIGERGRIGNLDQQGLYPGNNAVVSCTKTVGRTPARLET